MDENDKELEDIELTCTGCAVMFFWTVGEQEFMQDLFNKNKVREVTQPKRCKECRLKKKQEREARGLQD